MHCIHRPRYPRKILAGNEFVALIITQACAVADPGGGQSGHAPHWKMGG